MTESNSKIKKKIIKVFAVIIAILFILTLWVARIMLIKGDQYKKEALEQQTRDRLITPKRGTVYDRNGKPLAVSASVETVSISPKSVRDGEKVDETAELLSEVLGLDKKAVLELKGYFEPQYIAEMVEVIRYEHYLDGVIFISFDLNNLIELRRLLPEPKLMYLTCGYDSDILAALKTYRLDLDVAYTYMTPESVAELHENGIEVNCWTVDDPVDAARLIEMGVDYITTNILE